MEFKEGDWLIRKWNEEGDSDIDFARIKEDINGTHFYADKFLRLGKEVTEVTDLTLGVNKSAIKYISDDERIEFQWRKPTSEEIINYLDIEPNPFNLK